MTPPNGEHPDPLMAGIAAQRQAEQMLMAVLDSTLKQPALTVRANTSKVAIIDEPHPSGSPLVPAVKVLQVALPTGERWDIPLSPAAQRAIHRQLGTPEPTE